MCAMYPFTLYLDFEWIWIIRYGLWFETKYVGTIILHSNNVFIVFKF